MLKASLREKRHYIVFEVLCRSKVASGVVRKGLDECLLGFLGSLGYGKAGVRFIEVESGGKVEFDGLEYFVVRGILSVVSKYDKDVKAGIVLLKEVGGKVVICSVRGVSGTLKKVREKFL